MQITAQMIRELREKSGAGMVDCKKALKETNGDIEKAVDHLRKKGMISAAKKSGRVASEGLCNVAVDNNCAVIYEVNAETDFVAKNQTFKELVETIGKHLIASQPNTVEETLTQKVNGSNYTLGELIDQDVAKIGEKLALRRFKIFTKTDADVFGHYLHMGGKIATLVILQNTVTSDIARDIAMHVAAAAPKFLDKEAVSAEELARETNILREQALNEGRPEAIVEKMVAGRLGKFFEENVLLEQSFVKEPERKIAQVVKDSKGNLSAFARFEVGEGLEKRQDNFAEEVMNQLKN